MEVFMTELEKTKIIVNALDHYIESINEVKSQIINDYNKTQQQPAPTPVEQNVNNE